MNPYVKAVIKTNPDVLEIAESRGSERQNYHVRSIILGIPFLVQDNIATGDRMQTTAGCAAFLDTMVHGNARVVAQL